jgi:hypothetical protein
MATLTRRTVLGKAMAAALGLGGLELDHLVAAAAGKKPPVKRDPDHEYSFKVICDGSGKNCKVCWYDQSGKLLYCDSPAAAKK